VPPAHYPPLRTLADVLALEQVPIEQRITRWDFAQNLLDGCRHAPDRAALHVTDNGDLDGPTITWTFAELEQQSLRIANLLRASGVGANDAFAIVSPTVPALFATLIGGLLAARPFPINWMLDAGSLASLIRLSQAKVVIALGPTPGFSIAENVAAALAQLDDAAAAVHVARPVRAGACRRPAHRGRGASRRQAGVRAPDGAAHRHRLLRALRRHHRPPQDRQDPARRHGVPPVGGQHLPGLHARRRGAVGHAAVPHRRAAGARAGVHRRRPHHHRAQHARRARQALHRQLLALRREVRHHADLGRAHHAVGAGQEPADHRGHLLAAALLRHRLHRDGAGGAGPHRRDHRRPRAADLRPDREHQPRVGGPARRRDPARLSRACASPT
jgi:hypothetical protein